MGGYGVCVCVCDGCKEFSGPRVSRPVCVVVRVYINMCHTDAETGLYIRVGPFRLWRPLFHYQTAWVLLLVLLYTRTCGPAIARHTSSCVICRIIPSKVRDHLFCPPTCHARCKWSAVAHASPAAATPTAYPDRGVCVYSS